MNIFLFKYTHANGEVVEALFNEEKTVGKMTRLCENEDSIRSEVKNIKSEVKDIKDEAEWLETTNVESSNNAELIKSYDKLAKVYVLSQDAYKRLAETITTFIATAQADWALGRDW